MNCPQPKTHADTHTLSLSEAHFKCWENSCQSWFTLIALVTRKWPAAIELKCHFSKSCRIQTLTKHNAHTQTAYRRWRGTNKLREPVLTIAASQSQGTPLGKLIKLAGLYDCDTHFWGPLFDVNIYSACVLFINKAVTRHTAHTLPSPLHTEHNVNREDTLT